MQRSIGFLFGILGLVIATSAMAAPKVVAGRGGAVNLDKVLKDHDGEIVLKKGVNRVSGFSGSGTTLRRFGADRTDIRNIEPGKSGVKARQLYQGLRLGEYKLFHGKGPGQTITIRQE